MVKSVATESNVPIIVQIDVIKMARLKYIYIIRMRQYIPNCSISYERGA